MSSMKDDTNPQDPREDDRYGDYGVVASRIREIATKLEGDDAAWLTGFADALDDDWVHEF